MSARKWVRHPESGAVRDVAASAVPVMVQGGWQELTKSELVELDKQRAADREARVASLAPASKSTTAETEQAPTAVDGPKKKAAAAGRQDPEKTESD